MSWRLVVSFSSTVLILILSFLDMLVSEVKTIDLEQHKSTVTRRVVVRVHIIYGIALQPQVRTKHPSALYTWN